MINMIYKQAQNIMDTLHLAQDNLQCRPVLDKSSIETTVFESLANKYKVAVDM